MSWNGQTEMVFLYVWTGNAEMARAAAAERFPGLPVKEIAHHEFRKSSARERIRVLAGLHGRALLFYFRSLDDSKHLQIIKCLHWLHHCRETYFADESGRCEVVRRATFFRLIPSLAWTGLRDSYRLVSWWCRLFAMARMATAAPDENGQGQMDVGYLLPNPEAMAANGGAMSHIRGFLGGLKSMGGTCRVFSGTPLAQRMFENDPIPPIKQTFLFWEAAALDYNSQFVRETEKKLALCRPRVLYQRHARLSVTGALLSKRMRIPLILEYNGSEVWIAEHWDPTPFKAWVRLCEEVSIRSATRISVVSDVLKKELAERGVPEDKVMVNPNGVDPEIFHPDVGGYEVRRQLGIAADEIVVGFVGTFSLWHGIEVLQKAIARLLDDDPGSRLRFLLIGDGLLREPMRAVLRAHEESGRVIFSGAIAHEEVRAYLDAADILTSPHIPMPDGSSFFGSPTKVFEYMAMGKAIVASRLEQLAKTLEDDRTAVMVTPGDVEGLCDAIRLLAADRAKRDALGAAARQVAVDCHSWARNAARALGKNDVASEVQFEHTA